MTTTAHHDRRRAWAYLSRVVEGPCAPLTALVIEHGPEPVMRAIRDRGALPNVVRTRTESRHHLDSSADDLELLRSLGGRLITPDDEDWPAWRMLPFTGAAASGVHDAHAPLALWVLGNASLGAVTERAVAIVGTRAASSYGEHVTAELSHELAADGWMITSGAAYGIDGAAHRAALGAGGATIAVLACGVDRCYPSGHGALLRQIARQGLVISEYPPGTTPAKHRFLARNRLVAALSDGVVVVGGRVAQWGPEHRDLGAQPRAARDGRAGPGDCTELCGVPPDGADARSHAGHLGRGGRRGGRAHRRARLTVAAG